MLSLIIEKNYNILVNPDTGRWLGFIYETNLNDIKITDVKKEKIIEIYKDYDKLNEIIALFEQINKKIELKNDLLTKMNYLVLHTSDACNMKCKYCYAEDNIYNECANKMSASIMIDSINKFFDGEHFWVLFHGREPLTNTEQIIKTVEHFKDNKKIHFILQTNGMLLNESIIEKFTALGVKINISIDGFDDTANELRINNFTKGYSEKVTKLLQEHQDISPILILHKNNIDKICDISKVLKEQNHDFVAYNFLWPTSENPSLDKYVIDNETLLQNLQKLFEQSIEKNKETSYFAFKERDLYLLYGRVVYRHINNYMCNKSPCGAGKVCLCVNHNGDVYPCTTVNGQKENYMGNIYKNSKQEILDGEHILKHRCINNIEDCNKCPLNVFCGGGACSGLLYNYKKDINFKSIYCKYYFNMILYIMKKCIDSENGGIFLNK